MGLYDREYIRDDEDQPFHGPRTMVAKLIIANVVVFVICAFSGNGSPRNPLTDFLAVKPDLFTQPWNFWQLLTYGFVHSPLDIGHILFNMYGLWLFGRDVENIYGPKEFLRFYLAAIFIAGLVWVVSQNIVPTGNLMFGASGAVTAVMILYVMRFPYRQFLLFFVLPVPAWGIAVMFVGSDLIGLFGRDVGTAFEAHLAGAAFGFLYYRQAWNLSRIFPDHWNFGSWFRRLPFKRPKLKLHNPEATGQDMNRRVDEILAKISAEGEASLTREERRILEDASRRYQQRRN